MAQLTLLDFRRRNPYRLTYMGHPGETFRFLDIEREQIEIHRVEKETLGGVVMEVKPGELEHMFSIRCDILHMCFHGTPPQKGEAGTSEVIMGQYENKVSSTSYPVTLNRVKASRVVEICCMSETNIPQLVFVGTCHGADLAQLFTKHGVAHAIGSFDKFKHIEAVFFTKTFYRNLLVSRFTVQDAFDKASDMTNEVYSRDTNLFVLFPVDANHEVELKEPTSTTPTSPVKGDMPCPNRLSVGGDFAVTEIYDNVANKDYKAPKKITIVSGARRSGKTQTVLRALDKMQMNKDMDEFVYLLWKEEYTKLILNQSSDGSGSLLRDMILKDICELFESVSSITKINKYGIREVKLLCSVCTVIFLDNFILTAVVSQLIFDLISIKQNNQNLPIDIRIVVATLPEIDFPDKSVEQDVSSINNNWKIVPVKELIKKHALDLEACLSPGQKTNQRKVVSRIPGLLIDQIEGQRFNDDQQKVLEFELERRNSLVSPPLDPTEEVLGREGIREDTTYGGVGGGGGGDEGDGMPPPPPRRPHPPGLPPALRGKLHQAAKEGNVQNLKILLDNNFVLDEVNEEDQWTTLITAVYYKHEQAVSLLLERGAKLHHQDKDNLNAIWYACSRGNLAILSALRKKSDEILWDRSINDMCDNGRYSPLMKAVENCRPSSATEFGGVIKFLLENGANLALINKHGQSAVMIAAEIPHREAAMKIILDYMISQIANAHHMPEKIYTLNKMRGLIQQRENYFPVSSNEWRSNSPLLISTGCSGGGSAIYQEDESEIKSDDSTFVSDDGAAVDYDDDDAATVALLETFEDHSGANFQAIKDYGDTALIIASSLDIQSNKGYTALMVSAFNGHKSIVQSLLLNHADTTIRLPDGRTTAYECARLHLNKVKHHMKQQRSSQKIKNDEIIKAKKIKSEMKRMIEKHRKEHEQQSQQPLIRASVLRNMRRRLSSSSN